MKRGQATTVDRHSTGHEIGLFLPLEDRSYWVGTEESGNRQFVIRMGICCGFMSGLGVRCVRRR